MQLDHPFIHASKAQGNGTLRLTLFCTFFYHHNMEQEGKPPSSITFCKAPSSLMTTIHNYYTYLPLQGSCFFFVQSKKKVKIS
jgi:hypothetical protein